MTRRLAPTGFVSYDLVMCFSLCAHCLLHPLSALIRSRITSPLRSLLHKVIIFTFPLSVYNRSLTAMFVVVVSLSLHAIYVVLV
ncbi:hypothetical protein PYCCODRAFT_1100205 [Trametes coccinea BRFM310]|uniref:Uncharacterized protein n=1 Tax=Trametes coccinea (strain BRFM310) TaxID=1353009 RepID=A0A1Y2I9S9_TRAC3|nr:hypothetical protein PYCCODRAFT_1100205 [Trametes coccinea BRFM310]